MEGKFAPEQYHQYRDELAKELKEAPKVDESLSGTIGGAFVRERLLKEARETPDYRLANFFYREEQKRVRELVESGSVKTEQEALEIYTEQILEQERIIKEWTEKELCNPEKAPYFLISNKSRVELLYRDINNKADEKVTESLQKDEELVGLVDSLRLSDEEGAVTRSSFGYAPADKIPKNKFLYLSSDQKRQIGSITKDEQRNGLFLHELRNRRDKDVFAGCFDGFNDPTGGNYYVIAKKNLEAIFGERKIPYLTNTGDRSYSILPFGKVRTNLSGYTTKGHWVKYINNYPDQIKVLAAYGKRDGKKLFDNLSKTFRLAEKFELDSKIDQDMVRMFGKDYLHVKKEMPELLEFARELGASAQLKDINFEKKTAVFLGGRTEYGSSGGCGYWSSVTIWHDGRSETKDFQYRDRYSSANDRWEYYFKNLRINKVEKKNGRIIVSVVAEPHGDKKSNTTINADFEKIAEAPKFKELTLVEQAEFKNFVEQGISEILQNKQRAVAGQTRPRKPQFPGDTFEYAQYEQPELKDCVFEDKYGICTFSTKEAIDYGSGGGGIDDPQHRYEVYLALHGKDIKRIYEDHAYLKAEGDPAITGLRIEGNKVIFSTREGQESIVIDE